MREIKWVWKNGDFPNGFPCSSRRLSADYRGRCLFFTCKSVPFIFSIDGLYTLKLINQIARGEIVFFSLWEWTWLENMVWICRVGFSRFLWQMSFRRSIDIKVDINDELISKDNYETLYCLRISNYICLIYVLVIEFLFWRRFKYRICGFMYTSMSSEGQCRIIRSIYNRPALTSSANTSSIYIPFDFTAVSQLFIYLASRLQSNYKFRRKIHKFSFAKKAYITSDAGSHEC